MPTKEIKQILDYVIPIFESGADTLEMDDILKGTKLSLLEVKSAFQYLADQGYFKINKYTDGSTFISSPSYKALHYNDLESSSTQPTSQTNIFNAPVTGSAIGNTGTVNMNNGISFEDAVSFIRSQDISSEDKDKAEKNGYLY